MKLGQCAYEFSLGPSLYGEYFCLKLFVRSDVCFCKSLGYVNFSVWAWSLTIDVSDCSIFLLSFWSRGETFFDVHVTHVNSTCNQNKSTESIFMEHEKEKKRKYQQRVIDVEMGSFTPGFWHERRNGERMQIFSRLSNLADKLSRKNGESYASAISWLRTRISFEILRSVHTCVRGYRTPFHKDADFLDDFSVNARNADIFELVFSMFSE